MSIRTFEEIAMAVALDRYAVIAPLVARQLSLVEYYSERRRVLSSRHKFQSNGKEVVVSERTLQRWVDWYRNGHRTEAGAWICGPGLDALKPPRRSDFGMARVLTPEIVERAIRLRSEEPTRTTRTLVDLIRNESLARGEEAPAIEEASLRRHLRMQGATRKQLKREGRAYPRYEHAYRNAVWQGDWSQGIPLPDPTDPNKTRMCHLHAFIDDHTRYIPHAEFYFRQNLPCLEDCFRKAILKSGIPESTYWDNGAVYQSRQMQQVAGRLGTQVIFATPYAPEGKGKIERWFLTVKNSFYPEARRANIQSLDELNTFFWGWLEESYHKREHSQLKTTPRARWEAGADRVRLPAPASLVDLFLWEESRRVDKTGCVKMDGNQYPVSEHLVGKEVEVRFDPFDLSKVRIYDKGVFVETVEPLTLTSHTFRKALPRRTEKPVPLESSETYRKRLSSGFRRDVDAAVARARQQGHAPDCLDRAELSALLCETLGGRHLTVMEAASVADFFRRNAPLRSEATRRALQRAVEEKGMQRHIRFYLDAIRDARFEGGNR